MLVIIKICNCTYTSHIVSYCVLPKCCKEKEPKDEQLCITVHTINNNIHDANPLDNSEEIKHSQVSTVLHNSIHNFQKTGPKHMKFLSA